MQSSCILKIIELFILEFLKEKVYFNFGQFIFVQGMSTPHASLLLKKIVHSYYKKNKMLYILFAELSKAFDRVDHFLLGDMLLDRGIHSDVFHLVMFYLQNRMARVKSGTSSGKYSYINTGLRKDGILSPFLFKVYIDSI